MTERERWIVYPLLFLALGTSLRDKLIDRTTSRSIVCQELQVVEEDITGQTPPRVLARIGAREATATSPSIGYLGINGLMQVDGLLRVNGDIQSQNYSFLPGGSFENLLRGLQESIRGAGRGAGRGAPPREEPARPNDGENKSASPSQEQAEAKQSQGK